MPSSTSEARTRAALLALISIPAWACATASYDTPPPDSLLSQSEEGGSTNAGGSAGNGASAGKTDLAGAAGRAASGGSGNSSGSAGKGGAGSAGMSSGGKGGSSSAGSSGANSAGAVGKGGASSAGSGAGGTGSAGAPNGGASTGGSNSAGSNSAGSNSAGSNSAGSNSAGASSGGTTGSVTCDAAHAVATLTTSTSYTGKANDCVRLAVETSWSVVNVQLQPLAGTQGYPVPFSFFNCGGNGTGSLTADYANVTLKSGANPHCDFFVQFGGGDTTIKVTYYD